MGMGTYTVSMDPLQEVAGCALIFKCLSTIRAAEEGAADAAGEGMVAARAIVGHEEAARDGHGGRLRSAWTYCKKSQGVLIFKCLSTIREETARDGHGGRIRSAWTYHKKSQGVC